MRSTIAILISTWFVSSLALAKPKRQLVTFVKENVASISQALEDACTSDEQEGSCEDTEWMFKRFHLRIKGSVAFDMADAFTLAVVPQITLVWQKEKPSM